MSEPLVATQPWEKALAAAKLALKGQYDNFAYLKEGGTRWLFVADYVELPFGKKRRVVKIDKPPTSPVATRHVSRGYDTSNDAEILFSLDDAQRHHINILHGFRDLRQHGWNGYLSVEEFVDAPSLEERVQQKPLNAQEFKKVFTQVLDGVSYLSQNEIYHRDLKPSNILVRSDLETRITDLSNARNKKEVQASNLPTAGGHYVMYPLLISSLTGEEGCYSDKAEMYALGMTMLYSLTGSYGVEYDPDNNTAIRLDTKESILTNGKLDKDKHDKAIKAAVDKIKGPEKKYKNLIWSALTLGQTYTGPYMNRHSIEDFVYLFEQTKKPTFFEQMRKSAVQIATSLMVAGTVAGLTGSLWYDSLQKKHLEDIARAEQLTITPEHNGATMEIANNLIDLQVSAFNLESTEKIKPSYPKEVGFLRAKPGDKIFVTAHATILPHQGEDKSGLDFLKGKVYIDGFDGQDISVHPEKFVQIPYPEMGSYMGADPEIIIPQLPDGVYDIEVELYTPSPEVIARYKKSWYKPMDIRVPEKQVIMNRKHIPVIIGNPKVPFAIQSVQLGDYSDMISMYDIERGNSNISHEGSFRVRMPDEQFDDSDAGSAYGSVRLNLPNGLDERVHVAMITAEQNGKPYWYTFLPVKRVCSACMPKEKIYEELEQKGVFSRNSMGYKGIGGTRSLNEEERSVLVQKEYDKQRRSWNLAVPDATYQQRLVELRKQFFTSNNH